MIAPGPTLTTARLILRPTAREDFDSWALLMADEENSGFIGGPQERSTAWRGMMSMAGAWAIEGYAMFSVLDRETGEWLGRVGPWVPEGWPGTEVGWALLKTAWGKGYAMEAAVATIDWAFDTLGWSEVIHTIHPDNVASQVVAKRLGSTLRGPGKMPAPYEHMPTEVWGQTREQWKARVR
ncbi:MAG: GNAT family N-acetyltransferase [Caulobacteraceae bacterium]|nr:MAG: GNAT family N-acetyltransferase [Caulobacteraceae bacterium]